MFNIFKLFILFTAFIAMNSCKKSTTNPVNNMNTLSFLALGDSYTIGQSVSPNERFPEITVSLLNAAGKKVQVPRIIATTGWTTRDLLNALNNSPGTFDIVTLLIGVNNQYQGKSQEEYRSEFTALLLKAIQYAGNRKNRVFVLSIPDYSVTPFAQGSDVTRIAREIDEFNLINKQVSSANGVNYLDITPISREGKADGSLQAGDGLHPSGKQYLRWAQLLAPMIALQL